MIHGETVHLFYFFDGKLGSDFLRGDDPIDATESLLNQGRRFPFVKVSCNFT